MEDFNGFVITKGYWIAFGAAIAGFFTPGKFAKVRVGLFGLAIVAGIGTYVYTAYVQGRVTKGLKPY